MSDMFAVADEHTTRTFLAIGLDDATRRALGRTRDRLARELPSMRFVELASVHLTLGFLGEIDDAQLAATHAAAGACAREVAPFTLALGRVDVFGPLYAPRVLWVGVGGATDRLRAAQRRLVAELDARALPHDDKPFAAHLTLARRQRALSPDEQTRLQAIMAEPAPSSVSWLADEIAVMASELHQSGARYRRLAGYRLGTALSPAPPPRGEGS